MRSTSKLGKDLAARLFQCCRLPAAHLLRLFLALHNQRGTGSWCMRNKPSRGTSLWPSFRAQPCGSLCCYMQLKLQRSSSSQGHPFRSQWDTRAGLPLTASVVGTTNSSFILNNSQWNIYKCLLHHYHQYRPLVLNPSTQKPVHILQRWKDKKIQNSYGSYSTSLVDIETSDNIIFILNS